MGVVLQVTLLETALLRQVLKQTIGMVCGLFYVVINVM